MRFAPSLTDRRVFGKIAGEYDLVYFGTVDPRSDTDYVAVRGLTASPKLVDENYTTGNVYDYEVAFLQRSRVVWLANKTNLKRRWTILQIHLKTSDWPHIFINGRGRDADYGSLLASYLRLSEIGWKHFSVADFAKTFATYARLDSIGIIEQLFTPEAQTLLATHFSAFDYELQDDKLIIYSTNTDVSLELLDRMLRIGLWLARHIDNFPPR
jgi:hypothetical protein